MDKPKMSLRTPDSVELVEVIRTVAARGEGTDKNPVRMVEQYWSKDGQLLAEHDSIKEVTE